MLFCVAGFCIDRPGAFYFARQSFKFQAFLIHAEIFIRLACVCFASTLSSKLGGNDSA